MSSRNGPKLDFRPCEDSVEMMPNTSGSGISALATDTVESATAAAMAAEARSFRNITIPPGFSGCSGVSSLQSKRKAAS